MELWLATDHDTCLGGVLAYNTPVCTHCQYIATTPEGREKDVLALLFARMISYYTATGQRFFDFGISNEDEGKLLNKGLNRQKTSFGGSGTVYQKFEINVSDALKSLPTSLWPE